MEYLKSLLTNRKTINVATVESLDLPVNPVSHIDIDLEGVLNTAYTQATIANFGAVFTRLEVLYKGTSIVSLSGMDLIAYCAALQGSFAPVINRLLSAASVMVCRIRIPFGRYCYDPEECFPAVRRGDLVLRITYAGSLTNLASVTHTITTTELMGATPKQFMKATSIAVTPVVGDNDVDLPLGNKVAGLVMFSTTVPAGTASTTSVDLVKILRDNVEHYMHQVRWPVLNQKFYEMLGWNQASIDHIHRENTATAYTQNANTTEKVHSEEPFSQYGYIDFDPLKNNTYLMDTAGAGRIWLRITGGDTNVLRVIPIEIIEVPAAA